MSDESPTEFDKERAKHFERALKLFGDATPQAREEMIALAFASIRREAFAAGFTEGQGFRKTSKRTGSASRTGETEHGKDHEEALEEAHHQEREAGLAAHREEDQKGHEAVM